MVIGMVFGFNPINEHCESWKPIISHLLISFTVFLPPVIDFLCRSKINTGHFGLRDRKLTCSKIITYTVNFSHVNTCLFFFHVQELNLCVLTSVCAHTHFISKKMPLWYCLAHLIHHLLFSLEYFPLRCRIFSGVPPFPPSSLAICSLSQTYIIPLPWRVFFLLLNNFVLRAHGPSSCTKPL